MITSRLARTGAGDFETRLAPIEISEADETKSDSMSSNDQLRVELRRAFRLSDEKCDLPDPVPTSYYSNHVFPHKLINMLLLRLIQYQASLFTNIAQTPIQSRATQYERSLYNQFVARHKKVVQIGRTRNSGQKQSPSGQNQSNHQQHLTELHWPKRSDRNITLVLLFEFVAFLRAAFIMSMLLLGFASRSVRLSVSRDLNTIDRQVHQLSSLPLDRVLSDSVNETSAAINSPAFGTPQVADLGQRCLRDLVEFFGQRYGDFLFWNSTDGLQEYGEFVDEFLFLEQSKPVQMFRAETVMFMYIVTTLIVGCGLTGSIVTYYKPYDVIPLLFIYDPTYCAFQIKMRLMQHLNDARHSYVNYWSIFKLGPDFSLSMRGEPPPPSPSSLSSTRRLTRSLGSYPTNAASFSTYLTSGQRASFIVNPRTQTSLRRLVKLDPSGPQHQSQGSSMQPALVLPSSKSTRRVVRQMQLLVREAPSLCDRLYKDFLPDARSQAARRIFMLLSPTLSAWITLWLSLFLALTFIVFTNLNSTTVGLNRDLILFLERSPDWNVGAQSDQKTIPDACFNESRSLELFRTSLVNYITEQLGRLNGIAKSRQPKDRDQRAQAVAKFVAPTTNPDLYEWTIPTGVSILTAILAVIYMNIFFVCIAELCFWLFALRIKLEICRLILRYYSDKHHLDQSKTVTGIVIHDDRGRQARYLDAVSSKQHHLIIDDILIGDSNIGDVPDSVLNVKNEQTPTCFMNLGFYQVLVWAFSGNKKRVLMCNQYAKKLILADLEAPAAGSAPSDGSDKQADGRGQSRASKSKGSSDENRSSSGSGSTTTTTTTNTRQPSSSGRPSDAFLMSAYLEFRLFLEQIDACRQSINVITAYGTIHSCNILGSSMFSRQLRSRVGFAVVGYFLVNLCLFTASIFQSQCTKIIPLIHSMLALCLKTNKTTWHLAVLWQRSLNDLLGERSKFFFTVISIRISYASALQFNFGITSLYLLIVDRFRASLAK